MSSSLTVRIVDDLDLGNSKPEAGIHSGGTVVDHMAPCVHTLTPRGNFKISNPCILIKGNQEILRKSIQTLSRSSELRIRSGTLKL